MSFVNKDNFTGIYAGEIGRYEVGTVYNGDNMDLYIVEGHFDYEGFTILGIFDTEGAARSRACETDCEVYDKLVISKMLLNARYDISNKVEEVWKRA